MPLSPKAVRVRTSAGWQDIALQGVQGEVGPTGPTGSTGPTGPAGPAGAMTLIQNTYLSASATSISFFSIPQTYNHLKLIGYMRGMSPVSFAVAGIRLNGDGGGNYHTQRVRASGSTVSSFENFSLTYWQVDIPGANPTAGLYGTFEITIPSYKSISAKHAHWLNSCIVGGAGGMLNQTGVGYWYNGAAITQIDIVGDTYAAGSHVSLYGIT